MYSWASSNAAAGLIASAQQQTRSARRGLPKIACMTSSRLSADNLRHARRIGRRGDQGERLATARQLGATPGTIDQLESADHPASVPACCSNAAEVAAASSTR